jgi:hypothetical protein
LSISNLAKDRKRITVMSNSIGLFSQHCLRRAVLSFSFTLSPKTGKCMLVLTQETAAMVIVSLVSFLLQVAEENSVGPISDDVQPGRRAYVWVVDTVYTPSNSFSDFFGLSPSNLWTANPGDVDKIVYHYDGTKWNTDLISRPFSPFQFIVLIKCVWSGGYQ